MREPDQPLPAAGADVKIDLGMECRGYRLRIWLTGCLVWLSAMAFLIGCSPAADSATGPRGPTNNVNRNSMAAVIDGIAWSAASIDMAVDGFGATVVIDGFTGVGTLSMQGLSLSIQKIGAGQQILMPPQRFGMVLTGHSVWSSVVSGAGLVTVDTLDAHHASGSFEFTAGAYQEATPATRRVSAGRFDVVF